MEDFSSLLTRSSLLEPGPDEALDRLVRLAARVLDVPCAVVALRAGEKLFFKSFVGLPDSLASERWIPMDAVPCGHVLRTGESLAIRDAATDPRVPHGSPLAGMGVRSYVAVPLTRRDGQVLGAFAAMDTRIRDWTEADVRTLDDLAASMLTELEWRLHAVERASAADLLRQNEERYRLMVEGGEQVFFFTHDLEGRFEYVSPSVQAVLGYAPEDLVGQTYHVLLADDPANVQVDADTVATIQGDGQRSTYTALTRHRDGRAVVVEIVEGAVRHGAEVVGVQGFARDISERRRGEEELRVRTAHLEHLIEHAPEAIVLLDPDERVLRVNREFVRVFGYEADAAVGATIGELIVPTGDREAAACLSTRVAAGETVSARAVRRRRDGTTLHVSILATPVVIDGAPTAIFGIYRDITEQIRGEEAVRRSEEHFRSLIEHSLDVVDILDADGTIRYTTPSARRILGYDPAEVIGRSVFDFVHPDDVDAMASAFHRGVGMPGTGRTVEMRVLHRDGSWRIFEAAARNLLDDPAVSGVVLTSRDVTARVEAAAELKRNAVILASIPDAVVVTDLDGLVTYWNEGASRLFGWSDAEMLGAPLTERLPSEMRERFAMEAERVLGGESIHGEYEHVHRTGSRILADTRVSLIHDAADRPAAVLRITRDITEQRLLGRILDEMPEAVVCLDTDDRIVSCNATAERMFGYSAGEMIGQPIQILAPDSDRRAAGVPDVLGVTRSEGGWTGEVVRRRKDGSHFPALLTTGVVRDNQGRPIGQAGLIRDLTDEKTSEAQLRRAERMTSLGTLIGGLTHELNNPLTSIKSFAQLLLLDERPEEDREGLEVIHQEADRAAKLVADLRLLARQTQEVNAPPRQAVDLNDVVRDVLAERRDELSGAAVEVQDDLTEELLPVWCDRNRLVEAVRQLVVNAEQALRSAGEAPRLTLRTRPTARGVNLSVIDNGAGISPQNLERIFDPFWTTKAPGEGPGLGLSMVHSIVTEHGGDIRVESEVGKGSTFVVDLPWTAEAARIERPDASSASGLRILLVEDEAPIRNSLGRFLERRGHQVEMVEHVGEAIRRVDDGGRFEVIVSDFRMPGLSGGDLFHRLAERGDGTERRMIFVTGAAACPDTENFLSAAGVPVVVKPFQLAELAELIERVAANPPHANGAQASKP